MKYQTTILIVVALLVGLSFLLRIAMRILGSRRPAQSAAADMVRELPMGGYQPQASSVPVPVAQAAPAAAQTSAQSQAAAAAPPSLPAAPPLPPLDEKAIGRIRTITENDPLVATNVIRMWLQRP